jgi:hypothetical protein
MLCRVALVRTDVWEELRDSIIWVRIGELGTSAVTTNVVVSSPNLVTLMMEALSSSETSVLTRSTRHNTPEDGILHSHRRENLKSYRAVNGWALWRRRNVSPVKYELGFYIPEDTILHSHRREHLKSYTVITYNYKQMKRPHSYHTMKPTTACTKFPPGSYAFINCFLMMSPQHRSQFPSILLLSHKNLHTRLTAVSTLSPSSLELQSSLRTTVCRLVCLGVGPLFGAHDEI